jgi:hypothetical protein
VQAALFMWVRTKNGDMWVHYGTGSPQYAKHHYDKLRLRRRDLELMIVELPNPYVQAVKVSDV